ncbi:hypothetical protein DFH05DRAFT_1463682 [Lentinula detonsa]|uniref:Uncharacterized protein n=1 Tax=Lentinula detonsa TaxID=2804962 RepID=A0A9W8NS61_9AGAR|nr:hypothetical protein DFH05DRAFT_1463682 [Lentinula detonsa]
MPSLCSSPGCAAKCERLSGDNDTPLFQMLKQTLDLFHHLKRNCERVMSIRKIHLQIALYLVVDENKVSYPHELDHSWTFAHVSKLQLHLAKWYSPKPTSSLNIMNHLVPKLGYQFPNLDTIGETLTGKCSLSNSGTNTTAQVKEYRVGVKLCMFKDKVKHWGHKLSIDMIPRCRKKVEIWLYAPAVRPFKDRKKKTLLGESWSLCKEPIHVYHDIVEGEKGLVMECLFELT